MKQIYARSLMVIGLTAAMLLSPVRASAFWPFDSGNGQVLGTETSQQGGFFDQLRQFLSRFNITQNTTTIGSPSGATGENALTGTTGTFRREDDFPQLGTTGSIGMMPSPKARLDEAVKNGKITQAQEDEILSRLAAIRAKQQELIALEKMFADWMKANNISTSLLASPRPMMGGTGIAPTGKRYPMMPRPSGVPSGIELQEQSGK